jgi:hypothetical protein
MKNCPDSKLCDCLGWHCHGRVYELYTTREDYRQRIDGECAAKSKSPSLFTKGVNFVWAALKHAASGFQRASDEVYKQRISICEACERLNAERECELCGCAVDIKASWASQECPLRKWLALPVVQTGGCNCRR